MKSTLNLTTQRFGQLVVIGPHANRAPSGDFQWECLCDCGNSVLRTTHTLTHKLTISCGCAKHNPDPQRIEMVGRRFGRLTVLELAPERTKQRQLLWKCICDCGKTYIGRGAQLRYGSVASCGCREGGVVHGLSGTRAYHAILAAIRRCENKECPEYVDYGARGIRVCKRWHDPVNFHADMGQPPNKLTLDRINNDGHYSCGQCNECKSKNWPMNCRWASYSIQNHNRRTNRWITAQGKTMILSDWSIETGLPKNTIANRLRRGCSEEYAVTQPSRTSLNLRKD